MIHERSLIASRRSSFPPAIVRTHLEALAEARRACGRFKSVLPLEESLRSYIGETVAKFDDSGRTVTLESGMPLNWRRLVQYLHENRITAPRFVERYHRNDYPAILHNFELASMEDFYLADGRKVVANGFGSSTDREEAMSKAIGETLERFFLSAFNRDDFTAAPYADLAGRSDVLDIFQFDFFLDWQKKRFPQFTFDANNVFRWVEGYELGSGMQMLLPAQTVFWSYHHSPRSAVSEKIIFSQTTSGSAGHFTKDEAILFALLEAIQRDAFLIYWLNALTPKVIDTETIGSPKLRNLIAQLRRYKLEPIFLNTTSDVGVPTATCVVLDTTNPENPMYTVGSSSGFTVEEALLPGLIEAFSVQHFVSQQEPYVLPEKYEPFTHTTLSRYERLKAWRGPVMAERMRFFLAGEKQSAEEFIGDAPRYDSIQKRLQYIVERFAERGKGYEIYVYEVQHPVLLALGYHVVRTIVPELVPLYLVEFAAPLKARRLREVPGKIGYRAAEKFNPWPHPFP